MHANLSTDFNPRDLAIRAREQASIPSSTSPPASIRGPLERPLPEPVARVDSTARIAGSLRERIGPALTPAEALGYLVQVADALERLHRTGAVHGNLKPWNVVFRADGALILAGQAGSELREPGAARPGAAASIARYISPERVRGLAPDARHDLYCLGVIAWEMLTGGRPLYSGRSAVAIMCRHLSAPVPQLPLELIRFQPVLERLLAKERQDRYSSARELLNDLHARFADVIATHGGNVKPLDGARAA